jgi:hypothetical protein
VAWIAVGTSSYDPRNRLWTLPITTAMKANQLFILLLAGCGVVNQGSLPYAGSDAGSGSDLGSDAGGSDAGSDAGSDQGSGSGSSDAPTPGVFYGSVLDERNDAIDFSTGVPVHTHTGSATGFSGTGCPDIYKYSYLEGVVAPIYGAQTNENPLAFHIISDVDSLDASMTAYRVRNANGTLLDWTTMSPDANGVYTIDLRRDGAHAISIMGWQVGAMYVDARFHSTAGTDSIKTTCWNNHPLAAPLKIGAPNKGGLFDMSFANHSAISTVMNAATFTGTSYGAEVATFSIVQQTAEPTSILITLPKPTGTGSRHVVNTWVAAEDIADNYTCSGPCAPSFAATTINDSAALSGTWELRIVDYATGATVCHSSTTDLTIACQLPARATGAFAHPYTATLSLAGEASVAPPVLNTVIADLTYGTTWLTGSQANVTTPVRACSKWHDIGLTHICDATAFYGNFSISNLATISFDHIAFTMKTLAGDESTAVTPSYLGPLELPATTWSSGAGGF